MADRKTRFVRVFDSIRDELVEYFDQCGMPKEAQEWYKKNLDYNVPGGKLNRGISVTDSVEILKGKPLDEEEYRKAAILGWCVELLQAVFLVTDDIMDQSITRRGQPCWYRAPGVGNIAINDALILEGSIYRLLKKHFRTEPYYLDLLELFHETSYQTEMGQLVDLLTAPEDHVDLTRFSLKKHNFIVIYKTAFYSFYLPVALAMLVCSVNSASSLKLAEKILIPLGEYFQIQDDYLDCFGTPEQIGKIGTDIVDNKCSWLINVALQDASTSQRQALDENYGRKDAEKESRVKDVYNQLKLKEKYQKYEQSAYEQIMGLIQQIPAEGLKDAGGGTLKREIFKAFLDKIYKRTK